MLWMLHIMANVRPPLLIVPSIVQTGFLIQDRLTVLGVLFFSGNKAGNKYGQNNLANKSGKKRANKSWQTLGNPFLEVVPKPSSLR